MLIRKMTKDDIDSVLEIENACFSDPWTRGMFLNELSQDITEYRVAVVDEKIVGYMGMYQTLDEGNITNVAVLPEYRRQGIANSLIAEFIKLAQERALAFLTLEVRKSNLGAIKLYEQNGFVDVGVRPKYYNNTEDAILMTRYF